MIYYSLSYRKVTVKNANGESVIAYKAYATAQSQAKMSCDEFLLHQSNKHTSVYSRADYRAILSQVCQGIVDRCSDGVRVQVGEFGAFYPTIKSSGVTNSEDFNPAYDIKKVYVNWAKGKRFKNFANNTQKPEYKKVLVRVDEANVVQANNAGSGLVSIHSSAAKEAAFA